MSLSIRHRLALLATFSVAIASGSGLSAQPTPKLTVTSIAEAGPEFSIQGEYLGTVYSPRSGRESLGLQIIALGDDRFDAVQFRGGLPGNGWDGSPPGKMSGSSARGTLTLLGESNSLVVADRWATVYDLSGQKIGALRRVSRRSPTLGLRPPANSVVLFDGTTAEQFQSGKLTADNLLLAGALTKMPVQAFRLHLEFRTPYMPFARGQARGNSGVYIQQRYEVQILDSFGLEGVENECGSLYRQQRPDQNMCLPPLAWQTYDIWFSPPSFDSEGKKADNARITVWHNGIPIHDHRSVIAKTGGGKQEGPEAFPINLQDHGNPVVFRNIWLVPGMGDEAAASIVPLVDPPKGYPPGSVYCPPYRQGRHHWCR